MASVEIDLEDREAMRLWASIGELVDLLPGHWVLIGGLMVQLLAIERGVTDVRPTGDIDILGQARPQGTLSAIDAALRGEGFEPVPQNLDGYAHRYERDEIVIDLLAPDGIRPAPTLGRGWKAVGIPGGSQALERSEVVTVTIDGRSFELRRPTLIGAVLIKARSLMVHVDRASQREDLLRLLALIEDPRELAGQLRRSERRWLRDAEPRLGFADVALVDRGTVRRAELAYRLLIRDP